MTTIDINNLLLNAPTGRAALLRMLCRVCSMAVDTLVGDARVSYATFDDGTVECLSHGRRR